MERFTQKTLRLLSKIYFTISDRRGSIMTELEKFSSIETIRQQLESNNYISDQSLATVIYLAYHLHKPVFLEGEPGVGKTEVAIVLSEILASRLIRLQCYEGL